MNLHKNSLDPQLFLPEGKKGYILRCALELMITKWPFDFTIAAIARHGGLSKPLVGYHFKSTEEIIWQLMQAWAKSGQFVTSECVAAKAGATPEELIETIVDATFDWLKRCPMFARLTPVLIHLAQTYPQIADHQKLVMDAGLARIENILTHLPKLKKETKEKRFKKAKAIHLLIVGGFLYQLATKGENIDADIIKQIKISIAEIIHP